MSAVPFDRASEDCAAQVFTSLWPDSRTRQGVARFLADLIARAGATTTAWSITLFPEAVCLNVGPVRLLSLSAEQVWFCALQVRHTESAWLENSPQRNPVYSAVRVPSQGYLIPPSRVLSLPPELHAAVLGYVDAAASRRRHGATLWAHAHSPGAVAFLATALQRSLPATTAGKRELSMLSYTEGARSQVTLDRYERSRAARRACIEHHGTTCLVCGLDFATAYGSEAEGFIHVHHVNALADVGARPVDPLKDLIPVCPNCHAAIHLGGGTRRWEDVRDVVARSRPPNSGASAAVSE